MTNPLCFLDTETTGVGADDEIWEFAARRHDASGLHELHLFIEHDPVKAQQLPTQFYTDWLTRYPHEQWKDRVGTHAAARQIQEFTLGCHIIGACPYFDTEKIAKMMRYYKLEPKWNYRLMDVGNLIVGFLAGQGNSVGSLQPWDHDSLSNLIGIDPTSFARHTAMGDVLWTEAIFDKIVSYKADTECPF